MQIHVPHIVNGADLDLAIQVDDEDLDAIAHVHGRLVAPVLPNLVLSDVRPSPYTVDEVIVRFSASGGNVRSGTQRLDLLFGDEEEEDEEGEAEPELVGDDGGELSPEGSVDSSELIQAHERLQREHEFLTGALHSSDTERSSLREEVAILRRSLAADEEQAQAYQRAIGELRGLVQEREKMISDLQHLQRQGAVDGGDKPKE